MKEEEKALPDLIDDVDRMKMGVMGAANTMVASFLPALKSLSTDGVDAVSSRLAQALNPINLFKMAVQGTAAVVVAVVEAIKYQFAIAGVAFDSLGAIAQAVIERRWSDIPRIVRSGVDQIKSETGTSIKQTTDLWDKIFGQAAESSGKSAAQVGAAMT